MEKKAPEKKVHLREGDVFYVYDKRINKCVREDCEGIVKYGLTLQVNMQNGDTLNTYECNKCHMKYTAYPNYVRLTETKQLVIYNQEAVDACDRKRAADAAKQATREKKKRALAGKAGSARKEGGTRGAARKAKGGTDTDGRARNGKAHPQTGYRKK